MEVIEGHSQPVYDSRNTLQVLNMAVVAVKMIAASGDRVVLQQQYDTIINRLKFANIKDDDALKKFHNDLLKGITKLLLSLDEREHFKQIYERDQKRAIFGALGESFSAMALPGELAWLTLGSMLMRGANAFFGYRAAKRRLEQDLKDDLWHLQREQVKTIDELQRSLLNTVWTLSNQYGFSDDELISQDDLDDLEEALQEQDAVKARKMFELRKEKFKEYPPFWFYYGEAALLCGDFQTAEECFSCFDEKNCDVLSKNPYRIQIAKYRLLAAKNPNLDFIRRQLNIIAEDTSVWQNNLLRGVIWLAVNDVKKGKEALEQNTLFHYEETLSRPVLEAIESGPRRLWGELARIFYAGKGVKIDKVAAYKYAFLARLLGDTSVEALIVKIEGTSGWTSFFGKKPQISKENIAAGQAEAKRLFEIITTPSPNPVPPLLPAPPIDVTPLPPKGDTIIFGRYPQGKDGEVQPIEWQILRESKGRKLLISKYALDAMPYHKELTDITWENCTLRTWLNGEFLNMAFTDDERAHIARVSNLNPANDNYGTQGGNATNDRVFLLNAYDADQYFKSDEERQCRTTDYALSRVGPKSIYVDGNGSVWWWLRSPGCDGCNASRVNFDGAVVDLGTQVTIGQNFVRPALWIAEVEE